MGGKSDCHAETDSGFSEEAALCPGKDHSSVKGPRDQLSLWAMEAATQIFSSTGAVTFHSWCPSDSSELFCEVSLFSAVKNRRGQGRTERPAQWGQQWLVGSPTGRRILVTRLGVGKFAAHIGTGVLSSLPSPTGWPAVKGACCPLPPWISLLLLVPAYLCSRGFRLCSCFVCSLCRLTPPLSVTSTKHL